jgi:hypothetical protein
MDSYYVAGFWVGVLLFFCTLGAVFWLAGRLGCLGSFVRVVVVGLAILKVLTLLNHPPPG